MLIGATSTLGTITIRGNFTITDSVAGGFVAGGGTLNDAARWAEDQTMTALASAIAGVPDTVWDEALAGHSSAGTAGLALSGASAPTAAAVADAVWDEAIAGHLGAGSTGNALNAAGSAGDPWSTAIPGAYGAGTAGYIVGNGLNGVGSETVTLTVDDGVNPLDGVLVWVTTDLAGNNTVASGYTDASGNITMMLDAGSYYCWKQLSGMNFTNPEAFTVV